MYLQSDRQNAGKRPAAPQRGNRKREREKKKEEKEKEGFALIQGNIRN
jgi:hypothetical protein